VAALGVDAALDVEEQVSILFFEKKNKEIGRRCHT
jgi:hypothetical protein